MSDFKAGLRGLFDETGAQATGADLHPGMPFFSLDFHFLQVGIPDFFCLIVGMAYIVPNNRALTANITYSGQFSNPPCLKCEPIF